MLSNSRRSLIEPFLAIEMLTQANLLKNKGIDIVDLTVGEPNFSAIKAVREDAKNRLDIGNFGYTEALGLPSLRKAISSHYQNFYGIHIPYEKICVTVGASGGFLLSALVSFDPGDKVIMSTPYYPGYVNILKSLGVDVVLIEGRKKNSFQLTCEDLKSRLDNVKGVIVASPANPTGSIMPEKELKEISKLCKLKDIILIVDEIYHGITYEEKCPSTVYGFNDQAIIINSFSKYFAMTGWRLGWVILPEKFLGPFENLAMNFFLSPSSLAQYAAIKAFEDYNILDGYVNQYRINRDYLLDSLPKIGLTKFAPPQGAFYLYIDVSEYTNNSKVFVKEMLSQANVACVSGIDFDQNHGNKHVRFSYACKYKDIIKAVEQIRLWLKK